MIVKHVDESVSVITAFIGISKYRIAEIFIDFTEFNVHIGIVYFFFRLCLLSVPFWFWLISGFHEAGHLLELTLIKKVLMRKIL